MNDNQRRHIIETASRLFTTEGLKAVRMDDIAHAAGVSKRTIYEIFGDREELVYCAITHAIHIEEEQNRVITEEAPNFLIAMIRILNKRVKQSEDNWQLANALKRFYPHIHRRIQTESDQRNRESFKTKLEEGVQQGILNSRAHLDLAITMLHYIVANVVAENKEHPLPVDITPREALYEMIIYFLRGISTSKGIGIIDEYIEQEEKTR